MRKLEDLNDSPLRAFKTREALRGVARDHDRLRGVEVAGAAIATPGKATLTSGFSASTDVLVQLQRTMASAACDATNLEQANRTGDFKRASWAMAGLKRFIAQVPQLLAMVQRGASGDLEAKIAALVQRARTALDAGPTTSAAARQAADRGDFAPWRAEVDAWRSKADVTAKPEPAAEGRPRRDLISLLAGSNRQSRVVAAKPTTPNVESVPRGASNAAVRDGNPPWEEPAMAAASAVDVFSNLVPGHERIAVPASVEDREHLVAASGTQGPGIQLPHLAAIQSAFGHHDVSSVRAHIGGAAAAASDALDAHAYAYGDAIAFATAPDLHTAAHEAAHVVQQRQGVSRSRGGNDSYERHADRVASRVVRGLPVAALLDAAPRGGGATAMVQRKEKGQAGSEPAAEEAAQESAVAMGHEGYKTKFEYPRGNLTGAISLAIEAGKTGILLGDDHLKAFKNTASVKANGFVAKLETAILSGTLDRDIVDGVKLEFEAKALKLGIDAKKTSAAPLTIAVKLSGDVTNWFGKNIGQDRKVKLEGSVELTLGQEFVAKHLAKVVAAEIEQKALVKKMETATRALATHKTSVQQLEAQIAAARARGGARQEIQALRRQLSQHDREVRAGVKRIERLSRQLADAQARAARSLGGVKNFVAKKVGKALEKRALKFIAGKLAKIIPVLNAVSVVVDVIDLVVLIHAIIKGKYGSEGSGDGEGAQDGERAGESPGTEQSAKALAADAKQEAPERDGALKVISAAPPAVIGQWFSARGEELEFNEVGQAWKSAHIGTQIGGYKLVKVQTRVVKHRSGQWDIRLVFTNTDSAGKVKDAKHDFWVTRGGKAELGAKVGDLAFEPIVMIDLNGEE